MTDFAELGKHCDIPECHVLDFVPFKCAACAHTYCLDHRAPSAHHCAIDITQHNLMPRCPVCSQHVYVQLNGSADKVLSEHIDSGCKSHLFAEHEKARASQRAAKLHCTLSDCKNPNNYDTVNCKSCGLQYCLTHRSAEDHKCSHANDKAHGNGHGNGHHKLSNTAKSVLLDRFAAAKPKPTAAAAGVSGAGTVHSASAGAAANGASNGHANGAAAAAVAKPVVAAAPAAAAGDAKAAAVNLEQLRKAQEREHRRVQQLLQLEKLKLKHKAVGDGSVRDTARLYFWLSYPSTSLGGGAGPAVVKKGSPVAMFFDANWTVGKALQLICNASDLENRNNKPNEKRLEVFCKRTGAMFPTDISLSLLEPDLMSGDTLDLRYV